MFGLSKIGDLNISRRKLRNQISDTTGCSKEAADKRIEAVLNNGGSLNYCLENGLFALTASALDRYYKSTKLRGYAEKIAKKKGVKTIDVYRRMKYAKKEFGISYSKFDKYNLFRASDKALARINKIKDRKTQEVIEKIAQALDISIDEANFEAERINSKFGLSPHVYYRKRLYGKSDEEIQEFLDHENMHEAAVISKIAEETGWTEDEVRKDITRCNVEFGILRGDYPFLKCYELDDETLSKYGNVRDSGAINRRYNKREAVNVLTDKLAFNNYYGEFTKRKYWMNRDSDFDSFKDFAQGLDEAFAKPIDGSLGRGVEIIPLDRDLHEIYDELMARPQMILEERVRQHHELDEFYDNSVNTLRLFTVLDKDEFHVFAAFVRFGANGSLADNVAAGGVGCGVDVETGMICTPAMDHDGNFMHEHPNSHKKFEGFKFPHWEKALDVAERALRKNPDLNYIGWDLAIREDDVVIIEGNSRPDIGICQAFFNYYKIGIKPSYEKFLKKRAIRKSRENEASINAGERK